MDTIGFRVGRVATGVADVWMRKGHDLPCVRRIGEDFLVAGHRCVEDDFSGAAAVGANGAAMENIAVSEGKDGRSNHAGTVSVSRESLRSGPRRALSNRTECCKSGYAVGKRDIVRGFGPAMDSDATLRHRSFAQAAIISCEFRP